MPSVQHNALDTTNLHEPKRSYANLYVTHSDSATISTIGTTQKTFDAWAHNGPEHDSAGDYTTNKITVGTAGDYYINFSMSFSTVAVADSGQYEVHIAIDGVEDSIGLHRSLSGTDDLGAGSCSGVLALAAGAEVSVLIESDNGSDTDDINVISASLTVFRLGNT